MSVVDGDRNGDDNFIPTQADWDNEFLTPVSIEQNSPDPYVQLCKLNFKDYSNSPHLTPMFRFLVSSSKCGQGVTNVRLSTLVKKVKANRFVEPTGFIFHESRVGSTLIANLLASDPWSMVFSESAPAATALLHCKTCSREENVKLFRDVVTVMGASSFHKRLFFKFQSITSTKMDIALEAFPNVPFAFLYRDPLQTIMSHMDPSKSSEGAPCLRSMRRPPAEVILSIDKYEQHKKAPKVAWCAAHLNMLCTNAIRAYEKFGLATLPTGESVQRGVMVHYDSLPGAFTSIILPLFGIQTIPTYWLDKATSESTHYSKGGKDYKRKPFKKDGEEKERRATDVIKEWSSKIMKQSYMHLLRISNISYKAVFPDLVLLPRQVFRSLLESTERRVH